MTTDVLIVGAGHNGPVCAFYVASAGLKVKIAERRDVVGGAAVTEEFHPGFRNSVAAYTVSLLNPKVIADINLSAHGLTVVERRASNFLPQPEGPLPADRPRPNRGMWRLSYPMALHGTVIARKSPI
jgi:phytoene dehydrogenase-like protein